MSSIRVVAAVIESGPQILLARRGAHQDQAHRWEFPGGKVDPGESLTDALARELDEELGIQVLASQPLVQFDFQYPTKHIQFDIFRVSEFRGTPHGREGQPLGWFALSELSALALPAANRYILSALAQPPQLLITPEPEPTQQAQWLQAFERSLTRVRRVIFRAPGLPEAEYLALAQRLVKAYPECELLLQGPARYLEVVPDAAGLHWSSAALMAAPSRPCSPDYLWSVACHNPAQLAQAEALGADWALLSPVLPTQTHPEAVPLGWPQFAEWTRGRSLPVYALGGLDRRQYVQAIDAGAAGIAAIRGLWEDE